MLAQSVLLRHCTQAPLWGSQTSPLLLHVEFAQLATQVSCAGSQASPAPHCELTTHSTQAPYRDPAPGRVSQWGPLWLLVQSASLRQSTHWPLAAQNCPWQGEVQLPLLSQTEPQTPPSSAGVMLPPS